MRKFGVVVVTQQIRQRIGCWGMRVDVGMWIDQANRSNGFVNGNCETVSVMDEVLATSQGKIEPTSARVTVHRIPIFWHPAGCPVLPVSRAMEVQQWGGGSSNMRIRHVLQLENVSACRLSVEIHDILRSPLRYNGTQQAGDISSSV